MNTLMVQKLNEIIESGTRIVSFDYNGKTRNVLVGSNLALAGRPTWGRQVNRAIRSYLGRMYLVGIDNNDGHTFKTFALDKIENPSFVRA